MDGKRTGRLPRNASLLNTQERDRCTGAFSGAKTDIGLTGVSGGEAGADELPSSSRHDSVDENRVGRVRSRGHQDPSDLRLSLLNVIRCLTGFGASVSPVVSGRDIAWMAGGVVALFCALAIAGGPAWLLVGASNAYFENVGLLAFLGLLLALVALFVSGLGWLAIERGRNRRSSRKRYYLNNS